MKKGQILEGIITEVKFPNKCSVKIEGEDHTVQVKNGIPGQKVKVCVNKFRKGKAEGRILEILEKSALEKSALEKSVLEKDSVCPHFGACGGCTYQSLPYEEQLKIKSQQVQDLLNPVVENLPYEGIEHSPEIFAYRNKMEFTFGDEFKDGPLSLGMHKRNSFHDIVPVTECQIVNEDYRKILKATLEFFREKEVPYFHRMRHTGVLRHLLVRRGVKTDEILVDLIITTQSEIPVQEWAQCLQNLELKGTIAGILRTYNDSVADVVKDEGTEILYGKDYFYEELLGLKFKITPFSFFQTNSLGAEVLYSVAREFVGDTKDKVIFDLYSGTGTIAQILAPVAKRIVGVEIVEEAVEAAKENAKENGLTNCYFHAGDVLKVIDDLQEVPDIIVLDPPRDGIHPKALAKIVNFGVDRMVYVSCKPTSLARDLVTLQAAGYQVERVKCVDMFPGTVHVETVVLMSKVR